MKRSTLCLLCILLTVALVIPGTVLAQSGFNQKDKLISAGLGLGMYGVYGSSSVPPIFAMYEMGVAEKISVGGLVAYSGSSDEFGFGKWSYTYIVVSARGSYHFLEGQKNFDAYAGAGLGYDIVSSSVSWKDPTYQNLYGGRYSAGAGYFFFDVHVGGRYYFSPHFAAMAELGYGVGFFRIGVTYKL